MATAQFIKIGAGVVGSDHVELARFGDFLLTNAIDDLNTLMNTIDGKITAITWTGDDATQFEDNWEEAKRMLKQNVEELLHSNGEMAKAEAAGQLAASSRGGQA
jgi:hypothetical protein